MKRLTNIRIVKLTFVLIITSLYACQKDYKIAIVPEENLTTNQDKFYPIGEIVTIGEDANQTFSSSNTLQTRAVVGDIEDDAVIIAGVDQPCPDGSTSDECLYFNLDNNRYKNDIDTGRRIGIATPLALGEEGFTKGNVSTCYDANCGYVSQENNHSLDIKNKGLHRVQVTALSSKRNLDLFIYKLTVVNGKVDSTLISSGTMSAGVSETVNINGPGYYTLVVDEKTGTLSGSDYALSVSRKTCIDVKPVELRLGVFGYQLRYVGSTSISVSGSSYNLYGWQIEQVGSSYKPPVISLNSTVRFGCYFCDYVITPVFKNAQNLTYLGKPTLIKP